MLDAQADTAQLSAAIVLLNSPENLVVGLDYNAWRTGPKFMGIRSVPPGPHFLSWRPPDEEETNVLGLFVYLERYQVLVRRWSSEADAFVEVDDDEAERYSLAVSRRELDGNLGPYPMEYTVRWRELSRFISKATIDRIEPVKKFVMSATKEYSASDRRYAAKLTEAATSLEPGDEKTHVAPTTLFFCDVPKSSIPARPTPSEVTRYSVDRSSVLFKLIATEFSESWEELLGELQFAYICFLLGQNHEGFEHWRNLIVLLCSCDEAVTGFPELFENFLREDSWHVTRTWSAMQASCTVT